MSDVGPLVVAVLTVVLVLAGIGRGLAAVSDGTGAPTGPPGVTFHICHAGPDEGTPADHTGHDCCDACALGAPATLAEGLDVAEPALVTYVHAHAQGKAWVPTIARRRTPRQAQGPPPA